MAITRQGRKEAGFISGATYTSASIAFVSGRAYIAEVWSATFSTAVIPSSIAGSTMTFTKISDKTFTWGSYEANLSVWAAIGNGNTETVTATWGSAPDDGVFFIQEWSTDTGSWSGASDVVPQVLDANTGTGTAWTSNTLAALRGSSSYCVGMLLTQNTATSAGGAGFSSEGAFGHDSPASLKGSAAFKINVTAASYTWPDSSDFGGIAYEVAGPVAAASFVPEPARRRRNPLLSR